MLQSYIDGWVEELDLLVSAYEYAVIEVERVAERVEQASVSVDPGEQLKRNQYRRELESALESAQQIAALVMAVNIALDDAINAAQLVVSNEQVDLPFEQCEECPNGTPTDTGRAPTRDAPTIFGVLDALGVSRPYTSLEPLPGGAIVIQGKYHIVRLLHRRPRLNLYLAERSNVQSRNGEGSRLQPLVAIRELVLTSLSPEISKHVERAAFEEFAAPLLFGSPHLPGVGDRLCVENERHYTVMQLRQVRGKQQAIAVTLAELLLHRPRWPAWLDVDIALNWGMQLCRIVARLHRLGATLGDLHPAMILVDPYGATEWAPVLLASWPPPSRFWSTSPLRHPSGQDLSTQLFPIAMDSTDNAFAAPEIFKGVYDERSDVYSLGAILYWLLTRYAPVTASPGVRAGQHAVSNSKQEELSQDGERLASTSKELIPPHLFNRYIPLELEQVVVSALSLNPSERYSSVDALLEALTTVDPRREINNPER